MVNLSPGTGLVGTPITLSGTGFRASQTITITFDGLAVSQATSDADGNLSANFNAPIHPSGTHKVSVSDGTNKYSSDFTISASFSLSATTGYSGAEVTASGTGFKANQAIPIILANELVTTADTDDNGRFTAIFIVPALSAGSHKVTVSDGINTLKTDFSISSQASIAPITNHGSPGHIGTELTVNGNGFTAGRTVTITYDGRQIATVIVNTDGIFSATFSVPISRSGEHIIMANDGTTSWPFTFFMETTPPPIPRPLKPAMGVKAEAKAFFDWEDVSDPSGITYTLQVATNENFPQTSLVLDKPGLTQSEHTTIIDLPSVSKDTPYYYWHVRAVDGASNESQWTGTGSFYVGSTFALSQTIIYTLLGIGALLLGVLAFWLGRKTAYY